ncbi:MAG: response regulator transcription factor [Bacteroidetes bacterium]|nr:response regulator transcription factor [Bacteroidota bacterium]
MTDQKLNLALIDDHRLLTTSLSNLLSKYEFINSITIYSNPKEFLKGETEVDIIISDLMMPEMSGIDLLDAFSKHKSKARIILLTSVTEVPTVRHALRNGAFGYLCKDSSPEELADAILTVHQGEVYIGESLRNAVMRNSITEDRTVYNLSPREKEVLVMVCSGKTIKETAYDMGLSANTVQTYYKTIMKKFNLNRTVDLIVFAIRNGLYNPSGELPK